jgi:putative cell wall-binding protein
VPSDGAWTDLGDQGPVGVVSGAWSGDAVLVHDDTTDAVWTYDGRWARQGASNGGPPGVGGTAVAFLAGRLWAFGGRTETGADRGELWAWTPAGGWQQVTGDDVVSPGPRSDAALASDGTHLYLYGGRRSGILRDDLWRFDPAAGAWTQLAQCRDAALGCPGPRARAALVAFSGALWLHGGEGPDGATSALHRFSGSWELVAAGAAPPPVTGHGLVATDDALLAVGGCTGASPLTWRYDLGSGWRELHPTPMAPAVQGAAVVFDGTRTHQVGGDPCGRSAAAAPLHAALVVGADPPPDRRVAPLAVAVDEPVALGVALSRAVFADGAARAAVLGTANGFADSLAGAPLTWGPGGAGAPLVFSRADALSSETAQELERALRPGAPVYLLGGQGALSAQVEADVRGLGFDPVRLSGPTRVETAAAIARRADALRDLVSDTRTVLLADSRNYPDAVAAGGFAAAAPVPILLTPGDAAEPHPAVAAAIDELGIDEVVLLGGRAALSEALEAAVADLGVEVTRVAGQSRDGTATAVAAELWERTERAQGYAFVAVDLYAEPVAWAGALAAVPLSAAARAPLLALNAALPDDVPPATGVYLDALDFHPGRPGYAWIVGAAPDGAADRLAALLGAR